MSFFDMIQSFDTSVLEFIQNTFKCSFLDPIMAFFSYIGEMGLFWIAVGIVFIIFKKTRSMGVMMLVAMAIGFLVGEIGIKNLINRPRPFMVNIDYSARPSELNPDFGLNIAIPSGSSFPSGHSCSSLAAATVMLIKDKRFGIPALVLALLIVFSRLYNYVHYPSDVLSAVPALEGTTLKVPVSGVKGNALVAIRDASGKNVWSFHIWVTEASDLTYINEERGTFKMMDRNLGATSVTPKDQNAYGAWYQWGRKDPFPRPLDIVRSSATTVDNKELTANATTSAEVGTVSYTISNPDTRIFSTNDWHNEWRNNGLWGNSDGLTKNVKTVYDPCPEGYCVPDQNCYQGFTFTSKTECDNNYGHLFVIDGSQTSYFPTGGYLDKGANKIAYQEYRGYQWTSNPGTTGAYYFYYNNANLNFTGMDRASAASVRCVRME